MAFTLTRDPITGFYSQVENPVVQPEPVKIVPVEPESKPKIKRKKVK